MYIELYKIMQFFIHLFALLLRRRIFTFPLYCMKQKERHNVINLHVEIMTVLYDDPFYHSHFPKDLLMFHN